MEESILDILNIEGKYKNIKIIKMQSLYQAILYLMLYALCKYGYNAGHNQVLSALYCFFGSKLLMQAEKFLTVRY